MYILFKHNFIYFIFIIKMKKTKKSQFKLKKLGCFYVNFSVTIIAKNTYFSAKEMQKENFFIICLVKKVYIHSYTV